MYNGVTELVGNCRRRGAELVIKCVIHGSDEPSRPVARAVIRPCCFGPNSVGKEPEGDAGNYTERPERNLWKATSPKEDRATSPR